MCSDLDFFDCFLSSYKATIESTNSRQAKLKAKLLYKPKKVYNHKRKTKKLNILPTIYEETTQNLKSNSMECYTNATSTSFKNC